MSRNIEPVRIAHSREENVYFFYCVYHALFLHHTIMGHTCLQISIDVIQSE
jgi:hypothetical protein